MKIRSFISILLGILLVVSIISCTPGTTQADPTARPTRTERPPLPSKTPASPPLLPTKTVGLPPAAQATPTQNQPAGNNIIEGEAVAAVNLEVTGSSSFEYAFITDYGHQVVVIGPRIAFVLDQNAGIESVFIPPVEDPSGNNVTMRTTDGSILMADYLAQESGQVQIWAINPVSGDFQLVKTIDEPTLTVITLEFSPNGRMMAVGYNNGEIRLFDTDDGSLMNSIQAHTDNVTNLTFSYNNRYLASDSWSFDPFTYVFDTANGAKVATLSTESYEPGIVSFSPDGSLVSATSSDGTHIFTTNNWQETGVVIPGIWEENFTCDSQMLMVSYGNAMTDLYSVSTGQQVGTIENAPLYCYFSELVFLEMNPAANMINIIAYTP